jgi:hypothetical protein
MGRHPWTSSCRWGSVEAVTYYISNKRYEIFDPLRCFDPAGSLVPVSYLPGDPADGHVVAQPDRGWAVVAFVLAFCAAVVGTVLGLRRELRRRRKWRLVHHYATGDHPLG